MAHKIENAKKQRLFLAFKLSNAGFIKLINVKMPTIVGILTFMSRIISNAAELSKKRGL